MGRSLIGRKASRVSRGLVASVSRRSDRACDSEARVYADGFTDHVRGSRARKSVVVRLHVTLILGQLYAYCLLVCQSFPNIDVNASL